MYKCILLAFVAASSCGSPKTTTEDVSEENTEISTPIQEGNITLALDEKIKVGDLQIHFKEVLEDSRCPTGTNCIWQGRIRLLVETSEDGMTVDKNEIIFGKLKNGEVANRMFYKSGKITITATSINPYPTKEIGTAHLAYKLALRIGQE